MDKLAYTAMTGAKYLLARQDTAAQNLAHAGTQGYRAQVDALRWQPLEGAQTRVFATDATVGTDTRPGPVQHTGNDLDVALVGKGWIAVQANDGNEAYTRFGGFMVNPDGMLQTRTGLPVLGNGGGPITVPADARLSIGEDGAVAAIPNTGPRVAVPLGTIKLVNPEDSALVRGGDGLFRLADGAIADADPALRVQPQALEGSNVNAVDAMVTMIAVARQFEMQMKMLSSADENARHADKLLANNG
jgi:flagellar basal-body rod protein FlgF